MDRFLKRPREEDPETIKPIKKVTTRTKLENEPYRGHGTLVQFNLPSLPDTVNLAASAAPRKIAKSPDLDLLYFRPFLSRKDADILFHYLRNELSWYKVTYNAHGTQIITPRYTTVFGFDHVHAPGHKFKRQPRAIPPALVALKSHVEEAIDATVPFNFVLCNYYHDGKDSISYHSDDEHFLGPNPTIVSLSLGGTRDFLMRHKSNKFADKQKFALNSGDMIVMRGSTQTNWMHAIPKRTTSVAPRINITFRRAVNTYGTDNYLQYNVGDGPSFRWENDQMCPSS